MKNSFFPIKFTFSMLCLFVFTTTANGQLLKKLGKRAEKAAERTIERRVERETSKKTDEALDSIFESGKKGKQPKDKEGNTLPKGNAPKDSPSNSNGGTAADPTSATQDELAENGAKSIQVYSKFDFVPGDKLLFFDNFTDDFTGDFPSKWNTNSSGELVQIGDSNAKWLNVLPGSGTRYIPDVTSLPEEFTFEFDVVAQGLNNKTSSESYLAIIVGDNNTFDKPKNYGMVEYSLCQFISRGIIIENNINGKREIRNNIAADIRNVVLNQHHISVAVNKQRFRMWINEQKLVDVPRLLAPNVKMNGIKINLRGVDINRESIYMSNFKVAKGGVDLRRKLMSEGKISTNGILFDSGSSNIQPQSMGIIRQIYQVLQQEAGIKLKIVGHTDSDGDDGVNIQLSKKRADAVKNALITIYNISKDRLLTAGKGESEPLENNDTPDGKAQNRRVEFIKQ